MKIDNNISLDELDIVIPCNHHPTLPSSSSSSKKVLEVRLIFIKYKNLVYYHTNGRRLVSTQKSESDPILFNPFCDDCNDDVFTALLMCYDELNHLRNKMRDEAIGMCLSRDSNLKFKVYEHEVDCFALDDERVCDEEEFRVRVCDGNRVFVEDDVPIIQGLERVNNVVHDDDDNCGICLQNLKSHDTIGGGGGGGGDGGGGGGGVIPKPFLAMLPCKHVFHEPCVIRWFLKDRICPLCRYQLSHRHPLMSDR